MFYVYIIQSLEYPDQIYIGITQNLRKRIINHNSGTTPHTTKYKPWNLVSYLAFSKSETAIEFEKYLKSHSGRAFAAKRLY